MDIHKGLGNANKIMNEILIHLGADIQLSQLKGGSLRNAIPRESFAKIMVKESLSDVVKQQFGQVAETIRARFQEIEPDLELSLSESEDLDKVLSKQDQQALLASLEGAHNGVYRMSPEIPDLVEASNNIAKVNVAEGSMVVECLTRSSVEESKKELTEVLGANFGAQGFKIGLSGSYPGWSPTGNSPILKVLLGLYRYRFGKEPNVVACHAGLECGIIGSHYPEMDMISFGPTIRGAHSPDERVSISSTDRFWMFLCEILKNIPLRKD